MRARPLPEWVLIEVIVRAPVHHPYHRPYHELEALAAELGDRVMTFLMVP